MAVGALAAVQGDLFDFDVEVEPILEVLVGKTLEQSMMEVMEEEELANMRAHQEHFEQIRNAELAETQRLEEAEKRRMQEKERRVQQEKERVAREAQVTEKVAARTFTKGFLSELQIKLSQQLVRAGNHARVAMLTLPMFSFSHMLRVADCDQRVAG